MKKFLLCLLIAMMVLAASVSAVNFEAGEGFYRYRDNTGANEETGIQVPTEIISQGDNFIEVKTGGYYDGTNIDGGVYTTGKVGLNGLRVIVDFEEVPAASRDCWFTISFLNNTQAFDVGNFAEHGGYVTLIRYNGPAIEAYGYDSFGGPLHSANDQTFSLQSGTRLVCDVYYEFGQLMVKYTNGDNSYTMPADATAGLDEKFPDAAAYIFVCGSSVIEDSDWKYKVTVYEGSTYSADIYERKEFDKSKSAAFESIEQAASRIEEAKVAVEEAFVGMYIPDEDRSYINEMFEVFDVLLDEIDDAKHSLTIATNSSAVEASVRIATTAASEAESTCDALVALSYDYYYYNEIPDTEYASDEDADAQVAEDHDSSDGGDPFAESQIFNKLPDIFSGDNNGTQSNDDSASTSIFGSVWFIILLFAVIVPALIAGIVLLIVFLCKKK